jgi:tetratricopeptide (TPR) repeat protein
MYIESGQYQRAIEALNVYVTYSAGNDRSFALLGRAYFENGEYQTAIDNLDKAEKISRNGMRDFYVYRGLAHLELGDIDQAVDDLEEALKNDETSFDVSLGLARAYFIQEKFGSAFVRAEVLMSVADTDEETALALYWHALSQEKRGQPKSAVQDWQALLALDADVMTAEMRAEAEQHLKAVITPTNTAKPVTPTATKKGGTATPTPKKGTATPTAKAGSSTATVTVTPTAGKAAVTPSRTLAP